MGQHFRIHRNDTVNLPDGAYRFDFELRGSGLYFVGIDNARHRLLSAEELNQAWIEGRVQHRSPWMGAKR
jgi:hypothetical protein